MKLILSKIVVIELLLCVVPSLWAQSSMPKDSLLADIESTLDATQKVIKQATYIKLLTRESMDTADAYVDGLIAHYAEQKDTFSLARMLSMKAFVKLYQNRTEDLVKLARAAYELQSSPVSDTAGLAITLARMGIGSSYFERYDEAIDRTTQALHYFEQLQDTLSIDLALNNLGIFTGQKGDLKGAIGYYKRCAQVREKLGRYYWYGFSLFNIAGAYEGLGNMDSSYAYLLLAETIFTQKATIEVPAMVKLSLANYHKSTGNLKKEIILIEESKASSSQIGNTEIEVQAMGLLAEFYYADGQYKKAYEEYRAYDSMQYLADSANNRARVTEIEEKYNNAENRIVIEELKVSQMEAEKGTRSVAMILVGVLCVGIVLGVRFWYISQKNKVIKEKEKFELQANLEKTKLLALKSQMNPHFIFNSINIAQSYILEANKEKAYEHLDKFARLLRLTLDYSDKIFIPLEDEITMVALYLELEQNRFGDKFEYELQIDDSFDGGIYEIPGMILQPFIENALIHGVLNLPDGGGAVSVKLVKQGESVQCEITDNGVGRAEAMRIKEQKGKHLRSIAIYNIQERLNIIGKQTGTHIEVSTEDLLVGGKPAGTRVSFVLPLV